MATKNIKKILLNKYGNNYVADIEDIENRITQNSSNLETAKQELSNKCNKTLSQAKAYTDQEKAKYLPLTGGTVTGDVVFTGSVGSNSPIKANLQGTADRAIGDINGKALTSYIANLMVSGASVTVTNGAGEAANFTVDNVNHATQATHADSATSATFDANNNNIQETYINKVSASDVSGILNFTNGIKVQGYLLTIG